MNYQEPELQDRLAAEYVVGTLHGGARRRFERLLQEHAGLREAVQLWEEQLDPLARRLSPEPPPPRVWRAISRRLRPAGQNPPLWERLGLWRGFTLAAIASSALLVAVLLLQQNRPLPPDAAVAIIADPAGEPVWVLSTDPDRGLLQVRAEAVPPIADGQALELWLLPEQGPPRSLGLLPTAGSKQLTLPGEALQRLAVSLEPAGGSPTGQPTGPVLYQARVLSL